MTNESMAALRRAREALADIEDQQIEAMQTANNLQTRRQQLESEIAARKAKEEEARELSIRGRIEIGSVYALRDYREEAERELRTR